MDSGKAKKGWERMWDAIETKPPGGELKHEGKKRSVTIT